MAENQRRLHSDTGVQLWINRSIQVEGTFGVLKQDLGFRWFLHRGNGKVHKMLYLLAMGFKLTKLHKTDDKRDEFIYHYLQQNKSLKLRKMQIGLMAYLGASKNKKYQENLGFYKPNFLGISYIVKGLQLECGKTTFCYSPPLIF
ncbi:transposase [Veillonella sp.]|uniref:transposase n=1 Tax=Veillonella sp. TaxID=1926307 RepID=UPI001DE6CDB1|nr:transposase [Veillonella sp.]MBS7042580.1 transposase [Veillonella sp.]